MGIFSFLQNLFGGSQSSEVDADVERIFMKIDRLLNDEAPCVSIVVSET